jgi:hypothetical protein
MNEVQARQEGLSFTGHYSQDKDEVKANAKKIRDAGFNARVVNMPTSKLSRGSHSMGYSVYADKRYFAQQTIDDCNRYLNCIESRKQHLKEQYEKDLAQIDTDKATHMARLTEAQAKMLSAQYPEYSGEDI